MNKAILLPAVAATMIAAALPASPSEARMPSGSASASLRQTVAVNGVRVTPLSVLEDSRCPQNARCIWAGQVRIRARIVSRGAVFNRDMTLDKPIQVRGATIELTDVRPERRDTRRIRPQDYRFRFRFERIW